MTSNSNPIFEKAKIIYIDAVVDVISKDLALIQYSGHTSRYTYRFGKPYLPGHPHVPPSKNPNIFKNTYTNDVEVIYPVYDIFKALKNKYSKYVVTMDKYTFDIRIDW